MKKRIDLIKEVAEKLKYYTKSENVSYGGNVIVLDNNISISNGDGVINVDAKNIELECIKYYVQCVLTELYIFNNIPDMDTVVTIRGKDYSSNFNIPIRELILDDEANIIKSITLRDNYKDMNIISMQELVNATTDITTIINIGSSSILKRYIDSSPIVDMYVLIDTIDIIISERDRATAYYSLVISKISLVDYPNLFRTISRRVLEMWDTAGTLAIYEDRFKRFVELGNMFDFTDLKLYPKLISRIFTPMVKYSYIPQSFAIYHLDIFVENIDDVVAYCDESIITIPVLFSEISKDSMSMGYLIQRDIFNSKFVRDNIDKFIPYLRYEKVLNKLKYEDFIKYSKCVDWYTVANMYLSNKFIDAHVDDIIINNIKKGSLIKACKVINKKRNNK